MSQRCLGVIVGVMLALAGRASAASITVLNPSFENPALPNPGNFTNAPIPDWTGGSFRGVFRARPGIDVFSVPDGLQVAYIFDSGSISQDLGVTVQAGVTYQLDVMVGIQFGFGADWTVKLLASDLTVIASTSGSMGPNDPWLPVSISGAGAGTGNLIVELDSTGTVNRQPLFDNVRVQSLDSAAVPEPKTLTLLAFALAGLLHWGHSCRRRAAGIARRAPRPNRV